MKIKTVKLKTSKDCCIIANRHALVLKRNKPFIKWVKKLNPTRETDPDPDFNVETISPRISLFIKKGKESNENWLKKNFEILFEEELQHWTTKKKEWPKKRNYDLFRTWFDISFTPFIIDEDAGKPIEMV